MDYSEIQSIRFGVLSSEDIERNAVCMISNSELSGPESVYDERMGVIENGKQCQSCGLPNKTCPGHYGAIKLARPIFHPMYYKQAVAFLNVFCSHCARLYISEEHARIKGMIFSYERIAAYISSVGSCFFCNTQRCSYSYIVSESQVVRNTKDGKVVLSADECLAIFSAVLDSDIRILGLRPDLIKPKSLVMEYLPVIPVRARPYIISEGVVCDDDLTVVYQSIVKINIKFTDDKLAALIFHVSTLMNNSEGKSKHNNGGRPIKGVKERISGKDGIIRNNMSGKRVNQSARTVIGPDPTLRTNQVAIPEKIATKLTVSENVNLLNIGEMQKLVNNNQANFVIRNKNKINLMYACNTQETEIAVGDVIMRNGKEVLDAPILGDMIHRDGQIIEYKPSVKRIYELKDGDIVERHLRNNDLVLINRQPTLHKCSMLAKRVVVRPGKTMRLNLATTKVFNADFDGDEMNIHVPQEYIARVEMQEIAATEKNLISIQSSKPNIAIVQDGMLGAYLMTKNDYIFPKHIFMDICMDITYTEEKYNHVVSSMPMCGRALVSMILPSDFSFSKNNVVIKKGLFVEGVLTKSVVPLIIQTLYKDYGSAMLFIDEIQFIANRWLLHFGFSIGLGDCIPPPEVADKVQRAVAQCFAEAQKVEDTITNPKIRNAKISMALAKAKDMGMKTAKELFGETNGFVTTVTAGSKGDYFNICQITGLLGQQNVGGKRMQPVLNNGTRTLPHYPKKPEETDFSSTGFVSHSFIRGLKPQEFFFHAMSGREGVTDTALKTAVSGYTQRKMVKILEDVQVKYDGTVRNSAGEIIQWEYAADGLDRTQTMGQHTDFCDIAHLVDKLNAAVL